MEMNKRICIDCPQDISNLHGNCVRCKSCQKKYREVYNQNSMTERRKHRASHRDTDLGTTDFSPHRKKNFKKEAKAVKRELKNLGLR